MKDSHQKSSNMLPLTLQEEVRLGVPIDRGYAWFMVAVGFLVHMLFASCIRSMGILTVEYVEYYNCTRGEISFLISIAMSIFLFIAPVSSWVAARFSYRGAMILGSVLLCLAYGGAAYTTSLSVLFPVLGSCLGIGFSLVHIPCLAFINTYFHNRRGLATGTVIAGASAGAFVGPPLMGYLLQVYGLRGAQLLFGGVCLQMAVLAALLRPKEYFMQIHANKMSHNVEEGNTEEVVRDEDKRLTLGKSLSLSRPGTSVFVEFERSPSRHSQHHCTPHYSRSNSCVSADDVVIGTAISVGGSFMSFSGRVHEQEVDEDGKELDSLGDEDVRDIIRSKTPEIIAEENEDGSETSESHKEQLQKEEKRASLTMAERIRSLKSHPLFTRKGIVYLELLRDPWFMLYCIVSGISAEGMFLSFFLVPQFGKEIHVDSAQVTWILFWQGVPDLLSRVLFGKLADVPRMNGAVFSAVLIAGQGVAYLVCPIFPSYWGIFGFSVLLALTAGPAFAVRLVLGSQLLKVHQLPYLLGLPLVIEGVCYLVLPRIFGYIYDVSGSWIPTFVLMAILSFLSAAGYFVLLIPVRQRRAQQQTTQHHPQSTPSNANGTSQTANS